MKFYSILALIGSLLLASVVGAAQTPAKAPALRPCVQEEAQKAVWVAEGSGFEDMAWLDDFSAKYSFRAILQISAEWQLRWWRDNFALLPDCAEAQVFGNTYGQMLDETLIAMLTLGTDRNQIAFDRAFRLHDLQQSAIEQYTALQVSMNRQPPPVLTLAR